MVNKTRAIKFAHAGLYERRPVGIFGCEFWLCGVYKLRKAGRAVCEVVVLLTAAERAA